MANLIIKSSADNLVLQGSDASPAITVGATGTTTFAENVTLSGTANVLGTASGTLTLNAGSVLNHDAQKYAWHLGMDTNADHSSNAVVDFDATIFLGSGLTESGGQISVGANGAGLYFVSFSASNMNQDVNDHDLKIRVNGSVINDTRRYSNFLSSQTIGYPDSGTFAGVVRVSASQTIDVWGNGDMYGDDMTYFSGFRVGALT